VSNLARKHLDVVDAFARLVTDVSSEQISDEEGTFLRRSIASALRTQLHRAPSVEALSPELKRPAGALPLASREALLEELSALEGEPEDPSAAVLVTRSDEREALSSRSLVNSLSGLLPTRRLGPLRAHDGTDVWFNIYLPAHRMEIWEPGGSHPAVVLTSGRVPLLRRGTLLVDIDAGTVWVLGRLLDGALPANAYVGFKVSGGSFRLAGDTAINGNRLDVTAPITGPLKLDLVPDVVATAAGGCTGAAAVVNLPQSLTIELGGGASTVEGGSGRAQLWGQTFELGAPTGSWTFIPELWTLVLGYSVTPTNLDINPGSNDLVRFEGKGAVVAAGLGFPVVVATSPAILGAVAHSAEWELRVEGLSARWYVPETRLHALEATWIGISAFGVRLFAAQVPALVPAVEHSYSLWAAAPGVHRIPWKQTYSTSFRLLYGCHVVDGQYLLVAGEAAVAIDRPVITDGSPLRTPTKDGIVLLRQLAGQTDAVLAASIAPGAEEQQLALTNALVWTTRPTVISARGALVDATNIDAGRALLSLPVTSWVPTLPDPYVSNGLIRHAARPGATMGTLYCQIVWTAPQDASVSFEGKLNGAPALGERVHSSGSPRPAQSQKGPSVGPTQAEQDRLSLDRKSESQRKDAQTEELQGRGRRGEIAQQENAKSWAAVDALVGEGTPRLFLLDVSTNQDLLGVALNGSQKDPAAGGVAVGSIDFDVANMTVRAEVGAMRVLALPQVQWEPVRTLDADQDIFTMGWFPTPLASATDGGATQIAARSQKLVPVIPEDTLQGTIDAFHDGLPVAIRTTFPFGLIAALRLRAQDTAQRKADRYHLTRPDFPSKQSRGGIQITALAEGGRPDDGGISPMFEGLTRQLLNGVDLASGAPLGLSVLGETLQPAGSVETIFNNDMTANPRVPVSRVDISGYGGSNFSDWNNPFAAFAEAAKVRFQVVVGRTSLEVIKVNSVLHPWGIRVTRSITIERRSGGGVIRRDSGWQAFTPGIFDYRYIDSALGTIVVAPYRFDAGVFRGLFNVRNIRPAPGVPFSHGAATLVPYYFDADAALEGVPTRSTALGVLGYLQTLPSGVPADASTLRALLEAQGAVGGPVEAAMSFGGSGLPFRVQRVEVGLAVDASGPLFVATVRGVPQLPRTGAWSVVMRQASGAPLNGGEAVPVAESRGVPIIRRFPVRFLAGDTAVYQSPRRDVGAGPLGDYRFADAADLLTPSAPANDYALLQSTPTHAYLFPRPYVPASSPPRIHSGHKSALADIFARSTSKGSFPPTSNTIELAAGSLHLEVGASGKLALSAPVSVVGYPTPLRLAGTPGHGSSLYYDQATISFQLEQDRWAAEFNGLQVWSDISGLERLTGSELRVVGSTEQRPQIAEIRTLLLQEIEEILQYIPIFGQRGVQGPVDLGATNAKHEIKVEVSLKFSVPPPTVIATFPAGTGVVLTLFVNQNTGIDLATGGPKASATLGAKLEGKVPLLSVGVATVFLVVSGKLTFSLTSVSGSVTAESLDLLAFVGVGVEGKIGPFKAYAFLGIGFVLSYDAVAHITKYGGLVALEAGVSLVIVNVTIRAELKGLVYDDAGITKCDYSGSVKIEVDIFLIFSISATYQVTETANL